MAIRRRGDKWQYDLYDSNGKRIRGTVKINDIPSDKITKAQAKLFENILKGQLAQGIELASTQKDISFEVLVKRYLEWCDSNHARPDRDHIACNHLVEFFKGYKCSKVSLWLIEKYKKKRKDMGLKARTINIELAALRHMFNKALEWKLLKINPIQGIKLLRQEVREVKVISSNEFQKLYESAIDHFRPILLFAYFTGCRRSEIRKLRWENVDLNSGYVLIVDTKNLEERTIDLNDLLIKDKKYSNSEYVFTYKGKPYGNEYAWRNTWLTTLKRSGIKKCTFHDLRHSFVSNLIVNERVDFETVMSLSGHKTLSMLKRYTHTNRKVKKEAVKKLEKYINLDEFGHNLVTKPKIEETEESKVINITS